MRYSSTIQWTFGKGKVNEKVSFFVNFVLKTSINIMLHISESVSPSHFKRITV